MFDAEKLLGKLVGEVVGKGGSWGNKKKSVLGSLGSGSGLMTIIGLGVGAYEILKQQGNKPSSGEYGQAPPPPSGAGFSGAAAPPPPPPASGAAMQPPVVSPAPAGNSPSAVVPVTRAGMNEAGFAVPELAVRLIQVMVAAAHADGAMDAEEERAVLDKLRGADLSQEEKMFLLEELHRPKSIEELVAGISDPGVAKTMYLLASAAITVDTETERSWLDQLAARLGLSKEMQAFIEEQR